MKLPDASITKIGEKICELYPDRPNAEDIIERTKAMQEKNVKLNSQF